MLPAVIQLLVTEVHILKFHLLFLVGNKCTICSLHSSTKLLSVSLISDVILTAVFPDDVENLCLHSHFREKPKLVKPTENSNDGPEAKKAKVDPNETTMVKKVRGRTI